MTDVPKEIFVVVFPDGAITSFLLEADALDFVNALVKIRSERRGALTIARYTPGGHPLCLCGVTHAPDCVVKKAIELNLREVRGSDNLEGEK